MSRREGDVKSFETDESNIIKARVQLPNGEMVDSSDYRIELRLSKEAMLGLATNLIRFVHREDEQNVIWHLRSSDKDFSTQILGIYLHHGYEIVVL